MENKTVNHGEWTFDYNSRKNIFRINESTIDNKYFKHVDQFTVLDTELEDFRRAASVHKIVRNIMKKKFIPGAKIFDIVKSTENMVLQLFKKDSSSYFKESNIDNGGLAFPVGLSINNIIAHDSATQFDKRILEPYDIVKYDFGTHQNGRIIDSAFTFIVGEENQISESDEDQNIISLYQPLLDASKEATYSAISVSGPDARLIELSEIISEIINSYEIELNGKTIAISPVSGIGGHDILPYRIHGDKLIFSEPDEKIQGDSKMDDGEIYAIETYATTGTGNMTREESLDECTHFMVNDDIKNFKHFTKKNPISKQFKTRNGLPFSITWCDRSVPKFNKYFKQAVSDFDIIAYPPLLDIVNSRVSQFEHTIKVKHGQIEIFSKGEDY